LQNADKGPFKCSWRLADLETFCSGSVFTYHVSGLTMSWLLRWDTRLGVYNSLPRSVTARYTYQATSFPRPPNITTLVTTEDATEARSWVSWFKQHPIPRGAVQFTFSRSSGPGGQVCVSQNPVPRVSVYNTK
jgi:hypothetical protein